MTTQSASDCMGLLDLDLCISTSKEGREGKEGNKIAILGLSANPPTGRYWFERKE